jgi:uncharacterized membrane protein YtjA (UPF0391 family)
MEGLKALQKLFGVAQRSVGVAKVLWFVGVLVFQFEQLLLNRI